MADPRLLDIASRAKPKTDKYGSDDALSGNYFPQLTQVSYTKALLRRTPASATAGGRQITVARSGVTTTRSLNDADLLLS